MKKSITAIALLLIIVGIIGLAVNKFDFTQENTVPFEKEWILEAGTLQNLSIFNTSNDIDIEFVTGGNKSSVTLVGDFADETVERLEQIKVTNGQLSLDIIEEYKFEFITLGFNFNSNIKVIVATDENVEIDTLNYEGTSGNLHIKNGSSKKLHVTATSGDIDIRGYVGEIEVEAQSGNIDIKQQTGYMNVTSTSGDISIQQEEANDAIVSTSSGNVEFKKADSFAGYIDIKSNSGNKTAYESNRTSDELIKIRSNSGDITVK